MFRCLCYETKVAQGRGAASSHSRVNACKWSEAPCGEGMNLLIGQLTFHQALGKDGPWPPVGSQDTSVSCSDINQAQ